MANSGFWRRKCGYVVYINYDGYITKYFNENDEHAKVRTLDDPCRLEAFRQRLLRNGDLKMRVTRRHALNKAAMEVM